MLRLAGNKSIKLRELDGIRFSRRHSEREYQQVEQWWLHHRGIAPTTPPAAPAFGILDPSFDPWQPPPP
jgi:hypothetical protein